MQLQTSLTSTNDCKSLVFKELTAQNGGLLPSYPTYAGVDEFKITMPDGTVIDLTTYIQNSGLFPTADITVELSIPNTLLGLSADDKLPDGIYTVKYVVSDSLGGFSLVTFVSTQSFVISCQLACCLAAKITEINFDGCQDCIKEDVSDLFLAVMLLEGACFLLACGKPDDANKNIQLVKDYCNFNRCTDCN